MEVQEITAGEVLVLLPVGRLDTTTSSDFETHVLGVLGRGVSRLVVDCGRLDYVSSAGLRVLLMLAKRLSGGKGSLVLCSMSRPVQEVFEIAGFSRIFAIERERATALERASTASHEAGGARRVPRAPAAPLATPPAPPAAPAGSDGRGSARATREGSSVEDVAVRLLGGDPESEPG